MSLSESSFDHHAAIFEREGVLHIDSVEIEILIEMTERGEMNTEVQSQPDDIPSTGVYNVVEGRTSRDEKIIAHNVFCDSDPLTVVVSINSAEFIQDPDGINHGEEVTAICDFLGFQYQRHPSHSNPDDSIKLIKRENTPAGGGNTADWSIELRPIEEYEDRVNFFREFHNLVRTVQGECTIEGIYGPMNRHAKFIRDRLDELIWPLAFIQGVLPVCPKIELNDTNDISPDYVQIQKVSKNIGSSGQRSDLLFRVSNEIPIFLNRAYDRFLEKYESLHLKKVIGFYIDALNRRRAVDPRFANLCIAVEMLANHYDSDQGSTPKQIKQLINGLNVEFHDLLSARGSIPTKHLPGLVDKLKQQLIEHHYAKPALETKILTDALAPHDFVIEYFWSKARNHVIHGGSKLSQNQIFNDHEALIVLTRRLLREILLDGNTESLLGLQNLEPRQLAGYN